MNIVKFLENSTEAVLHSTAIIEDDKEVTYRDLWEKVETISRGLVNLGASPGDRIAIALATSIEYILILFAILKINCIAVPLRQTLTSYELKKIIKDCKPSFFVIDNMYLDKLFSAKVIRAPDNIILSSRRILKNKFSQRITNINDLLNTDFSMPLENNIATISYTYRGFGNPVGAMLSHENYINAANSYINDTELKKSCRVLLSAPLSFVFPLMGSLIAPLAVGATVVITKETNFKSLINLIHKLKINVIANVPLFYSMLLNAYKEYKLDLSSVNLAISGGSSLTLSLYNEIKNEIGWDIHQGYGLTECLPIICNPIKNNRPLSVGKLTLNSCVEIKVVDEQGNERLVNQSGEIIVKGKSVMRGYFNCPAEASSILKNGWLFTGDIGYFDDDGYLYLTGRKKQITKVGGNMVDLSEVRQGILRFPGIIDTKIEIVENEVWEHILQAKITVKNPGDFNKLQLKQFLRKRFPSYKIPIMQIN